MDTTLYNNSLMLTDGGLETTLVFNKQIDLRHFAAFEIIKKPEHWKTLSNYYRSYLDLAKKYQFGFILESATWRASSDWGDKLGYTKEELSEINQLAILQLKWLKREYEEDLTPILISGNIGPRNDGYIISNKMTASEAENYHKIQMASFKKAGVDMVSALTLNYSEEALGIVKAAKNKNLPVVISFTVETNGDLPSGERLEDAIQFIDRETDTYPQYYMVNCAHPSHFIKVIENSLLFASRLGGIRANASCKSHAELDEATTLDIGDRNDLAQWYVQLQKALPNLKVYGGCCGTDERHLEVICESIKVSNL